MDKDINPKSGVILNILPITVGIYLSLALATYSRWDRSFFSYTSDPITNKAGAVGAYLSDLLITLFGVSAFLAPIVLMIYGVKGLMRMERRRVNAYGTGTLVMSVSLLGYLITSSFGIELNGGGALGRIFGNAFSSIIFIPGAYIIGLLSLAASIVLISPESWITYLLEKRAPEEPVETIPMPSTEEARPEEVLMRDENEFITDSKILEAYTLPPSFFESEKATSEPILQQTVEEDSVEPLEAHTEEPTLTMMPHLDSDEPIVYPAYQPKQSSTLDNPQCKTTSGKYKMPSIDILMNHESGTARPTKEETTADSALLEQKLLDFGVQGKITAVYVGPVVTMYEFEPAPGVKINKIVSLSDDLALSLRARSVRISAIPGKAALGIEVPNRNRETVSLREIIVSDAFKKSSSKLTFALGKDIFGTPVAADLTKMPHLLVAGSTGSGKSVSVNSMVMSILYKASPDEVKMLLIDPKLLELSVYEGIPHLISPVITSPKEASLALKKMVIEMERRYRLLSEHRARSIDTYNMTAPPEERLPYIVVFIDELADLMLSSGNEVEDSIARLAQMARASGIHLILATQRPSVDVITGLIKANFPARISFQVTTKIDSRTILDEQGAEQLIGKGDMLFMLPGVRKIRIHGALVTEPEIHTAVEFIKAQGAPDYTIMQSIEVESGEDEKRESDGEQDEYFDKALDFAEMAGEISISSIQRRFKIGYNRAARIMDMMEKDGLVGPSRGAGKPRDYLGPRI